MNLKILSTLSSAYACEHLLTSVSKEANTVDPDQTTIGAV